MTDDIRFMMSILGLVSQQDVISANRLNNKDEIVAIVRQFMENKADELGMDKEPRYIFVDSDLVTRKWIVSLLGWGPKEHKLAVFEIDVAELLKAKEDISCPTNNSSPSSATPPTM